MDKPKVIVSDEEISELNRHFKIVAGPGAGKTHWLITHIQNVLKNASNLTSTSKIACITYTTVAGEEVQKRLGSNQSKVEVSTIHSFLYANIVKPYVYLLKDENGSALVDVERLDGHDENVATAGKIRLWQQAAGNGYINDKKKIKDCLEKLEWKIEAEGICLRPRKAYLSKVGRYSIKMDDLILYKQLFWQEGIIHHEDVIYFAYKLVIDYPLLLEHLSSKFPYIFLDEFQDTSPIQTEIIKKMSVTGTVIGVIGDPAQSIYKFQGASRQEFISFSLPNQITYSIENNRRCGSKIIDFLNHIRSGDELRQKPVAGASKLEVYFYEYGDTDDHVFEFHELRMKLELVEDYCVLARNNATVKQLKNAESIDIWSAFEEVDSDRERFIKKILNAWKLVQDGRQEVAIKEIIRAFKTEKDGLLKTPFKDRQYISPIVKRSLAVDLIELIGSLKEDFFNHNLFEFYEDLSEFLKEKNYLLKKIMRGKIKEFADSTSIKSLLDNLILPEENSSEIRTIHKAKGMEFESVLLYLSSIDDVQKLITPDIASEEDDSRILYVALSRTKKLLCIACPSLDYSMKEKLVLLNLKESKMV